LSKICLEAKKAKQFSVIFDKTTDVSNLSQLSINIRCIFQNKVNKKCWDLLIAIITYLKKQRDYIVKRQ